MTGAFGTLERIGPTLRGGGCIVHYLSVAPEGLQSALITGGLPPLERWAEDVYRATYHRLIEKNEHYYARYPEDVERVWKIVSLLEHHGLRADGERILSRLLEMVEIAA